MFNLENKVALVTGATSGIGQRQAIALSQAGAKIIAVGRNSQRLEDTLAELASPGVAVQCDLASADLSEVFTDAIAQAGGVDILCNTAVLICVNPLTRSPLSRGTRHFISI